MLGMVNFIILLWVNRKIFFEFDKNLVFGIQYLKYLNDKLGENLVLVIVFYNVGWKCVQEWLFDEGEQLFDVWIENIFYCEMWYYVKVVMVYCYIY